MHTHREVIKTLKDRKQDENYSVLRKNGLIYVVDPQGTSHYMRSWDEAMLYVTSLVDLSPVGISPKGMTDREIMFIAQGV